VCGVCVGGGGRAFYYTYMYSQKGRPCEVAELVGVLVAETIHPACMCEGGGRGGERGGRAFYYTYCPRPRPATEAGRRATPARPRAPKPSRWNDQLPRSWPLRLGAASSPRRARLQSAAEPDAPHTIRNPSEALHPACWEFVFCSSRFFEATALGLPGARRRHYRLWWCAPQPPLGT
jgi:hypothetical protein